jgi:enamine deaminase RidA (YjgF/YER057c/UK114 family)
VEKTLLNPTSLAKPSGYTHGIRTEGGRLLFLAGQPGIDANGKVAAPEDLVAQFTLALANLRTVIESAGGVMTDVVKLTIYVTDKAAYKANLKPIGAAYRTFFDRYYPATTLVEVESLFDEGAQVEIDGLAVLAEK